MINTISDIVKLVKIDVDRGDSSKDGQFKKWAIYGWKQLGKYNIAPFYSTQKLKVVNRRAALPEDYQEYSKIGLCIGGKIVNFSLNTNICLDVDPCCEVAAPSTLMLPNAPTYPGEWLYLGASEQVMSGNYSAGMSKYYGGYRIDKDNIVFDFDIDEIVLEYRGGEDNTYVPELYVQALVEYVHKERCRFSRDKIERSSYIEHKRAFIQEVKMINSKVNGMTISEIRDVLRSTWRHSIKI